MATSVVRPLAPAALALPYRFAYDRTRRIDRILGTSLMGLGPSRFTPGANRSTLFGRALSRIARAAASLASWHRLDVERLNQNLWTLLDGNSVGFVYQLRKRGAVLIARHAGWAKLPNEGFAQWSQDTPLMIASLSKLFTAVAAVRFLDDHGISLDAKIAPYLPIAWARGPGVGTISFRNLLTHQSSLDATPPGEDRIAHMRASIAAGMTISPDYRNVNYTLLRVLMYMIHLQSGGNATPAGVTAPPQVGVSIGFSLGDQVIESGSIAFFDSYTQSILFGPANVTAIFAPPEDLAHYYTWPNPMQGVAGVDERLHAGASGWCMTANDTLRAMAAFRRRGIGLTRQRATYAIENQFGLDDTSAGDADGPFRDTGMGRVYAKNGGMGMIVDSITGTQQCVGALLPGDMELVVFVNSNIRDDVPGKLENDVLRLIRDAIRLWSPFGGFLDG